MKNADMSAMPVQELDRQGLPIAEAMYGLTKREMIAMHLMAGLADSLRSYPSQCAKIAVEHADALLTELEETK